MECTYLTEQQAEEYSGFHRNKLRCFRTTGSEMGIKLPYMRIGKKSIRYAKDDIDTFIEKHRVILD